jgi:cobalt-zinc-cadmium efflux system membrane fusion protein
MAMRKKLLPLRLDKRTAMRGAAIAVAALIVARRRSMAMGKKLLERRLPLRLDKQTATRGAAIAVAVLIVATSAFVMRLSAVSPASGMNAANASGDTASSTSPPAGQGAGPGLAVVQLSESQLGSIKVEPVGEREFPLEKEAVGSIDFNEELSVQVFAPYQGRIISLFAKVGDEVTKGQTLFTIESPDLIQAEATLISAAGVLDLTSRALRRAKELYALQGIAQKDLEQAASDQQAAEGALKAARDAVRVFGKTDAEIDRVVATRKVDPVLVVPCPITGRITARNAAPGLLLQPGNPPAPFSVADISTMWMLANVPESDSPLFHLGQEVKVSLLAFPDRVFEGKITTIGAAVDPNTHRVMTKSEILDPNHELRSGMFATFVIRTGEPMQSVAVPMNGVVREGDGTMTAWVTTDRRRFVQREVKIGLQREGYDQILDGVQPGELIVTDGAILLSNMATGGLS